MSAAGGRIAPHDLDAEAAVLSAVMLDRTAIDKVLEYLQPEHFYSEANRRVFEAALAVHRSGRELDVVTVAGELRDRERLAQCGGAVYLAQLSDAVPFVANLETYAKMVHTKWRLRQVIATCQRIAAEGYGDVGDPEEFFSGAERDLHDAAHADEVHDEKTLGECAAGAYKGITELALTETGSKLPGVRTFLDPLDTILGGLRSGKLTILAASPGMGKSMLAQTIAVNVPKYSDNAVGSMVFTPEMTEDELGERAIASEARLDSMRFRAEMNAEEWNDVTGAVSELHKYAVWVTEDADITTTKMRARIRRRQQEFNRYDDRGRPTRRIGVVILDYLQLLNTQLKKGQSREEALTTATRELKIMAKALRLHVIAISSLNRAIAQRPDKRPVISDLRESGAIEFHADNILFLYRDSYYDPKAAADVAEVNVAKQRGGPTGKIKLYFSKGQSRFESPRHVIKLPEGSHPNPPHWSDTANA